MHLRLQDTTFVSDIARMFSPMAVDEKHDSGTPAPKAIAAKLSSIPRGWERLNREVIQRELEVESKAKDSMITRANTILAGAGVILGILINAASKGAYGTTHSLLVSSSMVLAFIAALFALSVQFIRNERTQISDDNLLATSAVNKHKEHLASDPDYDGIGDYELFLSAAYYDVLNNIRVKKDEKATYLKASQTLYAMAVSLLLVVGLLK